MILLRRINQLCSMAVIALGGALYAAAGFAETTPPKTLSIKVRTTQIRKTPAFFGEALKTLRYGDTVAALEPQGDWIRVSYGKSGQGFLHSSAVTSQKIVRAGSARDVGGEVDSADIVLAGKGFSPEVEKQYAASNADLDFAAVNTMERRTVSDGELAQFITSGKLTR